MMDTLRRMVEWLRPQEPDVSLDELSREARDIAATTALDEAEAFVLVADREGIKEAYIEEATFRTGRSPGQIRNKLDKMQREAAQKIEETEATAEALAEN